MQLRDTSRTWFYILGPPAFQRATLRKLGIGPGDEATACMRTYIQGQHNIKCHVTVYDLIR